LGLIINRALTPRKTPYPPVLSPLTPLPLAPGLRPRTPAALPLPSPI
jgi:hypothetical protein